MGRIRHKRNHHARRDVSRGARTRARTLDADQRQDILQDAKKRDNVLQPNHLDVDKPGLGLFYCIECDRHFPTETDRSVHQRSKLHKRIAKRMTEEKAYTVEESLRAAGIGIDNRQRNVDGAGASRSNTLKRQDADTSMASANTDSTRQTRQSVQGAK